MLDDFPSNQRLGHGDNKSVELGASTSATDDTTSTTATTLDLLPVGHQPTSFTDTNFSGSEISLATNSSNSTSNSSLTSLSNGDNSLVCTTELSSSNIHQIHQPLSLINQEQQHHHHQLSNQKLRLSSQQYVAPSSNDLRSNSYSNLGEVKYHLVQSAPFSHSQDPSLPYQQHHEPLQQPYSLLNGTIDGNSKLFDTRLPTGIGSMNAGVSNNQHDNMMPSAHPLDQTAAIHQYQLQTTKSDSLTNSSASHHGIALNVSSHDLLQQTTTITTPHHGLAEMNPHATNSMDSQDVKPHLTGPTNTFDHLGAASGLMQPSAAAAVGISNIWKNSMGMNQFKHPNLSEHSFASNADMNSFTSWSHSNNLSQHASASMTHHLLDGQHLIGYPHHRRSLPSIGGQDLVGISMKSQSHADHTSFMLNSINHQASTSQNSTSSSHQSTQPLDNLNIRSHPQDHGVSSYGITMNDNQFYNNSRSTSDGRSHSSTIKSSLFMTQDRPTHHMASLNSETHQSQLSYHSSESTAIVGIQTNAPAPLAGSSSGVTASRNMGHFRCPTCNEVFSLRTSYQSHLKTHSQDKGTKAKFSCNLCGHKFSQKTSLNRHMKSHTGERPFPCEICAKAFSEKERLKIHMRTHTGEKPFSCSICGKSFSQKSTVKRHQTVHTGEKKFKCDCGKGFANRGNLIAHIKTRGSNHFE